MGKMNQSTFHGFSGQIGNLVGSSWKGTNYIRMKAEHVRDAKTKEQVKNRNRFSGASQFASSILYSIIRPIWNQSAEGMSGHNLFVKCNTAAFNAEGKINDYRLLRLSTGDLKGADITIVPTEDVAGLVTVNWTDNSKELNASKDDQIRLVAIKEGVKPVMLEEKYARTKGTATFAIPFEAGDIVHLYAFFQNVVGSRFSEDTYQLVVLG